MKFEELSKEDRQQALKDALTPQALIKLRAKKMRKDELDEEEEPTEQTAGSGTVSGVEVKEAENKRPKHAVVTIRHGEKPKPQKDKDGKEAPVSYDAYPLESRVILTPEQSKQFTVGEKVRIMLHAAGGSEME